MKHGPIISYLSFSKIVTSIYIIFIRCSTCMNINSHFPEILCWHHPTSSLWSFCYCWLKSNVCWEGLVFPAESSLLLDSLRSPTQNTAFPTKTTHYVSLAELLAKRINTSNLLKNTQHYKPGCFLCKHTSVFYQARLGWVSIHENSNYEPGVYNINGLFRYAAVVITTDHLLHLDVGST